MALRRVEVAGVATTAFGRFPDRSLGSLTSEVVSAVLKDADLSPSAIQSVVFANAAGGLLTGQEMIRGQVALRGTGIEGIPIVNTENACASGSTAAHLAWLQVASGSVDVALAIGVEKLFHPDKARSFAAIESGTDLSLADRDRPTTEGSTMMGYYAREARRYAAQHGAVDDALAAIAVKNRRFAVDNPHAQFRAPISLQDVRESRLVADPLRLLTCSPITDGAAAIVFRAADDSARRAKVVVLTSMIRSWEPGNRVVERVATEAYRTTGLAPSDIDVFQLHDACAFAELEQYEQVGIAPQGGAIRAALDGTTGLDGAAPTNTDGGLLSRGHALGATGIAQLVELTLQLRNSAGPRQVSGATRGLAVNAGGWMGEDYATAVATILTTDCKTEGVR